MTSEAREASWEDGQPVIFFRFTRGTNEWFYTSSDRDEEHNGDTYTAAAIKRGRIRQGSDRARQNLTVTIPSALPVAANWRPYPPSEPIVLTVFTRHVGETDILGDWTGRVVSPKFRNTELELVCEPTRTRAKRAGIRKCWQRGCDLVLFSKGLGMCNLDPEPIPVAGTLTVVDEGTLTLTAAEFAGAKRTLAGSTLEWVDVLDVTQTVDIVSHTDDTIVVSEWSADFVVDLEVTAYTIPLHKTATLTAVDGVALTADAFAEFPSGRLAGGYIKWQTDEGLIEYRTISQHTDDNITLDYGTLDLIPTADITAYPGCRHTWADCGYHDNQENYGGDLYFPVKNPYSGDPIW